MMFEKNYSHLHGPVSPYDTGHDTWFTYSSLCGMVRAYGRGHYYPNGKLADLRVYTSDGDKLLTQDLDRVECDVCILLNLQRRAEAQL